MSEQGISLADKRILNVRGQRAMLDSELAKLYGIPTHRFNEAVKRNSNRFPNDFAFPLAPEEVAFLISQNAISKSPGRGGRRTLPWVFTEHGAVMAANVLNSAKLEARLTRIENMLLSHDERIRELYRQVLPLLLPPPDPPSKPIGFSVKESRSTYGKKGRSN